MGKTIQEQIAEMEERSQKLEEIHKLFQKMVKSEFGVEAKDIHKKLENNTANPTAFEEKITGYFGLKSSQDKANFIKAFCNEDGLNHYKKMVSNYKDSIPKPDVNKEASAPIATSDLTPKVTNQFSKKTPQISGVDGDLSEG